MKSVRKAVEGEGSRRRGATGLWRTGGGSQDRAGEGEAGGWACEGWSGGGRGRSSSSGKASASASSSSSAASTCLRKSQTRALDRMQWRNSLCDIGGLLS